MNQLAWGIQRKNSPFQYVQPAYRQDRPAAQFDDGGLAGAGVRPEERDLQGMAGAEGVLGWYIPDCEPRVIPEGAHVHESVLKRMAVEPDTGR